MKKMKFLALVGVLALASCSSLPKDSSAQARFDEACRYANSEITREVFPIIHGLLLARFGTDVALGFQGFYSFVQTTCSAPLDLREADAVIQRVWDAGGNIVALVIKAKAGD